MAVISIASKAKKETTTLTGLLCRSAAITSHLTAQRLPTHLGHALTNTKIGCLLRMFVLTVHKIAAHKPLFSTQLMGLAHAKMFP